jgi:hypothetical protein
VKHRGSVLPDLVVKSKPLLSYLLFWVFNWILQICESPFATIIM